MRKYRWLEQLHIKHYKTLLQLAQYRLRTLTGSTSEAEDACQFLSIISSLHAWPCGTAIPLDPAGSLLSKALYWNQSIEISPQQIATDFLGLVSS